jgi:hypothetical protein
MNDVIEAAAPAAPMQQAQAAPQQRPLTVIEHAIRSGASTAELRELMALQRDMDNHQLVLMREKRAMDEEDRKAAGVLAFRRDFAAFRGENIVAPKSKFVDRGKAGSFMQAEFGSICTLLSPALSKHGFGFRHDVVFGSRLWTTEGVESSMGWVYVTCFLEHRDGHFEKLDLEGPPGDLHANTAVQNMQATASYLKRQSLLAITGTATEDEDNENGMQQGTKLPKAQRREPDADSQVVLDALRNTGQEKATQGMKALTDWWASLEEVQRKLIMPEFGAMKQAARKFDEGVR